MRHSARCLKKAIQFANLLTTFLCPYPSCCSVDDGVPDCQFVDVSRVPSSDNGGDRNPPAHHSLHDIQISLVKPLEVK